MLNMELSKTIVLRLLLFNMKSGHTIVHETDVIPSRDGDFKVLLPHTFFHKIEAHFGKGSFRTKFTLTNGPFMLHGYVKFDEKKSINVTFEEE